MDLNEFGLELLLGEAQWHLLRADAAAVVLIPFYTGCCDVAFCKIEGEEEESQRQ